MIFSDLPSSAEADLETNASPKIGFAKAGNRKSPRGSSPRACFSGSRSSAPFGDKFCRLDKGRCPGPEWRQRLLGLSDKLLQPCLGRIDSEHADHRGLACSGVLAGRFADKGGIAFKIEQVVGDLERFSD